MSTSKILLLCVLAVTCGAQTPRETPKKQAAPQAADAESLVRDLGSAEFKQRSEASAALRKLGEKARPALEKALSSSNLEQRTRARTLLEELDAAATGKRRHGGASRRLRRESARRGRGRDGLSELQRSLERFERLMEESRRRLDRPRLVDPFEGLDLDLRDLILPDGKGTFTTNMLWGDDRIELRRNEDGSVEFKRKSKGGPGAKGEEQTWRADSLEEFQKKHPEVYGRYKDSGIFSSASGGFRFRFGPLGIGRDPQRQRRQRLLDSILDTAPGGGLGLVVSAVPAALRAHLSIPQRAVLVDRVLSGSTAEGLGVKRYDVLLEVNARAVGSATDIRRALRVPRPPPVLRVKILRQGAARVLEGPWPGRPAPTSRRSGR